MYKSLREIPNPYIHDNEIRDRSLFVGRNNEQNELKNIIKDYKHTSALRNIIIIGNKSVGKSSLLAQYDNFLSAENFLTIRIDCDSRNTTNSILFFGQLFSKLLENIKIVENVYSVIDKDYMKFYPIYENFSNSKDDTILLDEILKKDFEVIINKLEKIEYDGIAILIDDCQLLIQNQYIIDLLQKLMIKLKKTLFILSGNKSLEDSKFEKLLRQSNVIELKPFDKRQEIFDCIFKPIYKYGFTNDEILKNMDTQSIKTISDRSGGNPYHIQLICYHMFENFRQMRSDLIELSPKVISEIINKLKKLAPQHVFIYSQLSACNEEIIKIFRKLYEYQNLSIHEIVKCEMAFSSLDTEEFSKTTRSILSEIRAIRPFNLFKFYTIDNSNVDLIIDNNNISVSDIAKVKFKFIGDNIDSLYASYLVESKTGDVLSYEDISGVEQVLANHFHDELWKILFKSYDEIDFDCPEKSLNFSSVARVSSLELDEEAKKKLNNISDEIDKICTYNYDDEHINTEELKPITESILLFGLDNAGTFSKFYETINGFITLCAKVKILTEEYLFWCYQPVVVDYTFDLGIFRPDIKLLKASINEYDISISDLFINFIPQKALRYLYVIDTNAMRSQAFHFFRNENYTEAIRIFESIKSLSPENEYDYITCINNIGFIHATCGELDVAEKCLNISINNIYTKFLSSINMSYVYYRQGNYKKSNQLLRKLKNPLSKQNKENRETGFIHLNLCEHDKRSDFPCYWDIIDEENSVDLLNILYINLALLESFKNESGKAFGNLNKVNNNCKREWYFKRAEYWIYFNKGELYKALSLNSDLEKYLKEKKINEMYIESVKYDYKFFKNN